MTKVTIDIEPGLEAFELAYYLSDKAAELEHKIHYVKDNELWFIDYLKKQSSFFKRLSKQVQKQVSANIEHPVEGAGNVSISTSRNDAGQ